ncbi:MAG: DUF998 domain-containing protein [Marmoricola sp.]
MPQTSVRSAPWTALAVTFFVGTSVALPIVQRGHYDVPSQTISELALGSWGWLQNLAFCILGAGTLFLAVQVRRVLGARVAPRLLAVAAVLDVVSSIFHAVRMGDPQTTASIVHTAAGISTFFLSYAAMFALVRPLRANPRMSGFATPTLVWAVVSVLAFLTCAPPVVGQAHFGIGQRIMAATFMTWIFAISCLFGSEESHRS